MTNTIDEHEAILSVIQDVLKKFFKQKVPECKGWVLFCVSKLKEDKGPRTSLMSNCIEKHSIRVLTELLRQHIYEPGEIEKGTEFKKGEIWEKFQKTSKKE